MVRAAQDGHHSPTCAVYTILSSSALVAMSEPLSLASLTDEQLAAAFDFLPLLQHTLKQVAHVSEASPAATAPPTPSAQLEVLLREQQRRTSVQEGVRVLVKLDPWDQNQLHLWLLPGESVAFLRVLVEAYRRSRAELLPFDLQLVTEPKRMYAPGDDAVPIANVLAMAAQHAGRPQEHKNTLEFAVRNQPQPQNAAALQAAVSHSRSSRDVLSTVLRHSVTPQWFIPSSLLGCVLCACVQTSALIARLTSARDLLQLLPNIDVSQSEQEEESRRMDSILQRKRALLDKLRIQHHPPSQQPHTATQ